MADVNPAVEQIVEQLQEVAKELDEVKAEAAAPEPAVAPAPETPAPAEAPKAPDVPTADILDRLADPAAPAEFEDRDDSVGNTFRVWKDGRVERLDKPSSIR